MVHVVKSRNFDNSMKSSKYVSNINRQLKVIAKEHLINSNQLAPFLTGRLRNSTRTIEEAKSTIVNEWYVPYAVLRYLVNRKNPQTTQWAEKAYQRDKERYLRLFEVATFNFN